MAVVIAGERSGVGKTTVTLTLLASLRRRGEEVQPFKVGPDYIDPMFHQAVTGRPCYNLDPILTSEAYVQRCFATHHLKADYGVVEGVMGLFDGATGRPDWGSTAHIARLLDLPVVLVLDCSHLSGSVAAIAHGYRSFDPHLTIAGVVLNRVGSDRHLTLLQEALAPLNLPVLGVLRRHTDITIPHRHLGLVPTDELQNLAPLIDRLAALGDNCFNWSALVPLLARPAPSQASPHLLSETGLASGSGGTQGGPIPARDRGPTSPIRIAIARDPAFKFYYPDNLNLMKQLGAELLCWSPLADQTLPQKTQGLYLGGGFPELFGPALAENQTGRQSVAAAIQSGMPTYAECGGLMYLCESLQDLEGHLYPMAGILPTTVTMTPRLTLGYRQAQALRNTPLLPQGTILWGHEFHRSQLQQSTANPIFQMSGGNSSPVANPLEGWGSLHLHASYVHLHWGDRPELPARFLQQCLAWAQ